MLFCCGSRDVGEESGTIALRTSAVLLQGIIRIHAAKMAFLYGDFNPMHGCLWEYLTKLVGYRRCPVLASTLPAAYDIPKGQVAAS